MKSQLEALVEQRRQELLSDGWRESDCGVVDWLWFYKGEKNAYIYQLNGEVRYGRNFSDAVKELELWEVTRAGRQVRLYFCDPANLSHKPRETTGRLREGSGNSQNLKMERV